MRSRKRQSARREEPDEQAQPSRRAARDHRQRVGLERRERHHRQRSPDEQRARGDLAVHARDQRERLRVGAEQDVLAVVERQAVALDAPRAPAQHRGRLVQRRRNAGVRERDRGRASGPAATDDRDRRAARYAARDVFHAIHSLRSGVSDVRRSSTR